MLNTEKPGATEEIQMKRSNYSNKIDLFLNDSNSTIIGKLSINHSNKSLEELQTNAWKKQIEILKDQLIGLNGHIYFEFAIPRMGKRVDNIVIIQDKAFIIEFKVGDGGYEKHAIEQVIDYTLDLNNFHEGSHAIILIPILVATKAEIAHNNYTEVINHKTAAKTNKNNLREVLISFIDEDNNPIDVDYWENSVYKPTPTIIEAAQALYKGHNVKDITRSDSGAINLSRTASCLNRIVENSKASKSKSICFVTGVPGAGKTLAGLNIAHERTNADENEHAVFLSGNGPLVDVLREALAKDIVTTSIQKGCKYKIDDARRETSSFVQNIHHFRKEYLHDSSAPIEKVVVFDEAQRAWNRKKLGNWMRDDDYSYSEPQFLIDVMNRHDDWCTIICLIGGGQEINTGEAGLEEWLLALKEHYSNWEIHYSNLIIENDNYLKEFKLKYWLEQNAKTETKLHLSVTIRSFRSEKLSDFVQELLDLKKESAIKLYHELKSDYPIVLTRDLELAKQWTKKKSKGTERYGLIASSGARRLRPYGIDVKNEIKATNWFLNDNEDIRSSYYMEEVATEFDIQGLEIDWACVAWGANFHLNNMIWRYQNFKGTKWQNINKEIDKSYLKNTYRVLLTRARQGMVIFIPKGCDSDKTRPKGFYDNTYKYLKELGINELG